MRIRILGPLEVGRAGQYQRLPAAKCRALLAALIIRAGQPTSVDRLITELWPDTPPPRTATNQIHGYVARLRRALDDPDGRLLCTRSPGYELLLGRDDLDSTCFEDLAQQGVRSLHNGDPAGASDQLAQALTLWRGLALADAPRSDAVQAEADRLDEARLSAIDKRTDADLALGRHDELVAELRALTEANPYRESQWTQLMLALYRSGRQGDALQSYQRLYRVLDRELGVEPGARVRELHEQILANDRGLDRLDRLDRLDGLEPPITVDQSIQTAAPEPVPRQLPLGLASFTGRELQLIRLVELLSASGQAGSVAIGAIHCAGGVGKSALAVHAAHKLAGRFPDGQLYVDLHGATAGLQPLAPAEALGRFLRALGTSPDAVPADLEEASAAFRSRVAGRRLLVVLDNAASAAQVEPLLPASPGCGVLLTSRRALAVNGASQLHLEVLPAEQAIRLLGRLAGEQRVAAEPTEAADVARLCGQLPLALRIAGARLAARPGWPVRVLAERLADTQRRLDELELAEAGMRTSFAVSYQQLSASADQLEQAAAAAFGLLGLLDGPQLGPLVAARLLDQPNDTAERALERLVDAQLLETPAPGRYRLHDLLRLYAREQPARQHAGSERAAALTRAFGFYTASAWRTLERLRPGDHRLHRADVRWTKGGLDFTDATAALEWLESERANLVAAVQQAAATPGVPSEIAIQLAQALFGFFEVRSHWSDWMQTNRTALEVAERIGDFAARAQAHNDIGVAHFHQGQYAQALASHERSLRVRDELRDRPGRAATLNNLANVYQRQGHHQQALDRYQESVAIRRELGDRRGQAASLGNLGELHVRQGRYQEALACQRESLAIFRELGDRRGQANTLHDLGIVNQRQGRYSEALACQRESLAIFRELGDRPGEANALQDLGVVQQQQRHHEEALAFMRESLAIREQLGLPHGQAESLRELGMTLWSLGRAEEARAQWYQALTILERLHTPDDASQIRALLATTGSDRS